MLAKITSAGLINSTTSIQGADLRTTANELLVHVQNGGAMMRLYKASAAVTNFQGSGYGTLYFRDGTTAGTLKLVVKAGASGAETTILDNIPQT